MFKSVEIHEQDQHFIFLEGEICGERNKRKHLLLFKPDTTDKQKKRLMANTVTWSWSLGFCICFFIFAAIFSVTALLTHHFFMAPFALFLTLLSVLQFLRLNRVYNVNEHLKDIAWQADALGGNDIEQEIGQAYLHFIKGRNLVSESDWELLSVNDEEFYYECAKILELQDKIKTTNIGINGSAETGKQIQKIMQNVNDRVMNIKRIASLGTDAALYSTATNILSSQDAVPLELLEEADIRHRTLRQLTTGSDDAEKAAEA